MNKEKQLLTTTWAGTQKREYNLKGKAAAFPFSKTGGETSNKTGKKKISQETYTMQNKKLKLTMSGFIKENKKKINKISESISKADFTKTAEKVRAEILEDIFNEFQNIKSDYKNTLKTHAKLSRSTGLNDKKWKKELKIRYKIIYKEILNNLLNDFLESHI